jgi:hypothetical protein
MSANEKEQRESKPYIIAGPIYDTVFKRLMKNREIVKFFLSAILGRQFTAIEVRPQEFTRKKKNDEKDKALEESRNALEEQAKNL